MAFTPTRGLVPYQPQWRAAPHRCVRKSDAIGHYVMTLCPLPQPPPEPALRSADLLRRSIRCSCSNLCPKCADTNHQTKGWSALAAPAGQEGYESSSTTAGLVSG